MDKKNRHIEQIIPLDHLLKYKDGKLSPEEMNQVEQTLLENDFDEEALDGLMTSTTPKVNTVVGELEYLINRKVESTGIKTIKRFDKIYAVAAVISLVIISTVLLFTLKEPSQDIAQLNSPQLKNDMLPSAEETTMAPEEIIEEDHEVNEAIEEIITEGKDESKQVNTPKPQKREALISPTATKKILPLDEEKEEITIREDLNTSHTSTVQQNGYAKVARSKAATNLDETSPVPIPMFGGQSNELTEGSIIVKIQPPSNMKMYIATNKQIPKLARKGVVRLEITVKTDGSIGRIKIIKGLTDEINKEAIRLIEEGPKWTPATINGDKIKDKLEYDVTF